MAAGPFAEQFAVDVKLLFSKPNRVMVQSIFVQLFKEDMAPDRTAKGGCFEQCFLGASLEQRSRVQDCEFASDMPACAGMQVDMAAGFLRTWDRSG